MVEQVNVPNDTSASASINSPYEVRMWDGKGDRSVLVSSEDQAYWAARGFRLNKLDVRDTLSELKATFDAAKGALDRFVAGCVKDGEIDPSDEADFLVANIAMSRIAELYTQLVADISVLYPVKATGAVVRMVNADGAETDVPAEQAEMYASERGYSVVGG